MAMRIPWDEYETAILISACVDYNAGKCTKKEAIIDVSQTLRKRAEKNGIEIDDVFRNENGITMQFFLFSSNKNIRVFCASKNTGACNKNFV